MVSHLTRIEYYCSIRLDHHYGYGQSLNTDRVLLFYQTDHHYGHGQSLNTDRVLIVLSDWTITTVMVSHLTRIEYYCSIRLDHHYGHGQSLNTDRVLLFYQTGPSLRSWSVT